MTEHELWDVLNSTLSTLWEISAYQFTLISGYLIATFFIGGQLDRLQCSIMNAGLFVVSFLLTTATSIAIGKVIYFRDKLLVINPNLETLFPPITNQTMPWVLSALTLCACYAFMWQTRQKHKIALANA